MLGGRLDHLKRRFQVGLNSILTVLYLKNKGSAKRPEAFFKNTVPLVIVLVRV